MKLKNRNSIIVLSLILFLFSCNDGDWLDPKPLSFYAPENVYVNEEGFESLIITMRKNIKSEHYADRTTMSNEYTMSDLAVPGAQAASVVKDFPNVLKPSGDGLHNYPGRLFNLAYNSIRNANVLISRIEDVDFEDETARDRLLAVGYFYRSYWFYRLVNAYGDIPFIGEEISEPKLDFYTHSRWTILEKIQSDMEHAVQFLPETNVPGAETKGAGNHLLAKIALASMDFDKAIEAASDVINGPYELMTERFGIDASVSGNVIWDLHRPENINDPANTETIYSVIDRFEDPEGAKTAGNRLMRTYGPAWWHSRCRDSEGNPGTVADGLQYDTLMRGNGNGRLTPYYIHEIWDIENDMRRNDKNWVESYEIKYNNPNSVDYGKPIDPSNFASPVDTFQHLYSMPYYKLFVPEQDPEVNALGGNGDTYIFRLAETYLLRAEAYFWKNELSDAADDLNVVRQRAEALPITANDVDIEFIFEERARELMTESPRHGEMVRVSYIMAMNNLNGYTLENFSDKNWFYDQVMAHNHFFQVNLTWGNQSYRIAPHNVLWPIPETAISENTLGVINQNQGYSGSEKNEPPKETIE